MTAPPDRGFGGFVATARSHGHLVVQPRMGFGSRARMRVGLERTKQAEGVTVGTITLDSYTRVGDFAAARAAVGGNSPLNGYPLLAHGAEATRALLDGVQDESFPVQVRHGSARPQAVFAELVAAGVHATEGGPVSYCLPYSRTPLRESVRHWAESCELLASAGGPDVVPHLESFGGCMLGQLCPPGLLVALSVLEGLFFAQHGLRSISLSYAQQTSTEQDTEALAALHRLAAEELPPDVRWHSVLYAYMGLYPGTARGAERLLRSAASLAVRAGAARLIVKTTAEAHRIPTIAENVAALELAAHTAAQARPDEPGAPRAESGGAVYAEARALVHAVRELHPDLGTALARAFARGLLDIPFCLHPDNQGRTRSLIDDQGRLRWSSTGGLPLPRTAPQPTARAMTSARLLESLTFVQRAYDS
ncbi:methylaspartate mutase [Streptomyces sp. NBC_01352]|uniref:methylaspartate mutase n=1 Tax=Streptomyces sp. NBC_01352 TaxID=2903834 RepID=UPI002E318C97|nr:methylaspartate mutase [Streptomyces sp. NBC_01352]